MGKRRTAVSAIAGQLTSGPPVYGYYSRLEKRLRDYITVGRGPLFLCDIVSTAVSLTVRVKREHAITVINDLRILLPPILFGKPTAKALHTATQTLVVFTFQVPTYGERRERVRKMWEQAYAIAEREALRGQP